MESSLNVFWRNLSVRDLLNLCQSNKTFQAICNDPTTWNFLLQRDFGITGYVGDPKIRYMLEYCDQKRCKIYEIMYKEINLGLYSAENFNDVLNYLAYLFNTKSEALHEVFNDAFNEYIFDEYLTPEQQESEDYTVTDYINMLNLKITPLDIAKILQRDYNFSWMEIKPHDACMTKYI